MVMATTSSLKLAPSTLRAGFLGLILFGLWGCKTAQEDVATDLAISAADQQKENEPWEIVVPLELRESDPRFITRSYELKVSRLVHLGLTRIDAKSGLPSAGAARSWKEIGDDAIDFELVESAKFADGSPLGAADVCATIEAFQSEEVASPHRAVIADIDDCKSLGEHHVLLHWSKNRASRLSDLEIPILKASEAKLPRGNELVGLGPFRLSSKQVGDWRLEPVDNGVDKKPQQGLVVRTIRDANARVMRFLAGHGDLGFNVVPASSLKALDVPDGLEFVSAAGMNTTYLLLQNDSGLFSKAACRKQLSLDIDRAKLILASGLEEAEPARSMLPPQHWIWENQKQPEPEAGEICRGDFVLLTSSDRARKLQAQILSQMLSRRGWSIKIRSFELALLLDRLDRGAFDAALLQLPDVTEPNVLKWFFDPGGVPFEGGEGRNRARYRSEKVGHWLREASESHDTAKRAALYREIAAQMQRDMPVVPLYHEPEFLLHSSRARRVLARSDGRWLGIIEK